MNTRTLHFDPVRGWSAPFPPWDSASTLVLVFADRCLGENPAPLRELRAAYPRSCVIGCSTAGQVDGATIHDAGLVATVCKLESGSLRLCSAPGGADAHQAGVVIGRSLAGKDLRGVFVLSDGTTTNGTELARGLRESLPSDVCITGGLAGDGQRFERTWVCGNSEPQEGCVVAVGVYGEHVRMWHGCKGGWDAFGPVRKVTMSNSNKLFELDGKPALAIYQDYLGELAKELPGSALLFPLALQRPGESHVVVRTILGIDKHDHSMTFAGDMPVGSSVQLMRANFDRLVDAASRAATMVPREAFQDSSALCISISCVGRRLILKHRAEEELEEVLRVLPKGTAQAGFYSYGELSPQGTASCELHNQTMTLTIITERAAGSDASHARATAA